MTFAPLAWLKLQYLCHAGPTEVGGFGIAAKDNLLYVEDFVTVRQQATAVSVRFVDEAVADFFDQQVDRGLPPERFARLWCHTHPGDRVTPSPTDEETFMRTFGVCGWAVMFILSRTGKTYARLAFTAGPGTQLEIPVALAWAAWPTSLQTDAAVLAARCRQWRQEYSANVQSAPEPSERLAVSPEALLALEEDWWDRQPWSEELDGILYELCEPEQAQHASPT